MTSLADGFLFHASKNPHKPAFVLDEVSISYAELDVQATKWRQHLAGLTLQRDPVEAGIDYVAWVGANHQTLPALYLACLQSGYCMILLDPTWPSITTQAVLDRFSPLCVVGPETEFHPASTPAPPDCLPAGHPDSFFLLGFTSGSTGMPKAFIRTQRSWANTFAHASAEFPAHSRVLAPGPLSHGLSFYTMAEVLDRGDTFFCLDRFDAAHALQTLDKHAIEALVVVPTMLVAILDANAGSAAKETLKLIISAGAKLSSTLRGRASEYWPDLSLSEYYGASELSFVSVSHAAESAPANSVGRAFDGVEITVRNADGQVLETDQQGVVYVSSDMLADGYVLDGGEICSLNRVHEVVTVGDIGKLDDQGYLYLLDRTDNMIISGGLNVYPAEVQSILDACPDVQESRVVGIHDPYWGEQVCAFVRQVPGQSVSTRKFKRYCREYLSAHQVPRRIFTIEHWPMTSSGKIAFAELLSLALVDADPAALERYGIKRLPDE